MTAQLVEQLERYSGIEPPDAYWLEDTGSGEWLNCAEYCLPCAKKVQGRRKTLYLSGGAGWIESESCVHCAKCGKLLGYTLLKHGVLSELQHFTANPPAAPLRKEEAYHIARVLDCAWDEEDVAEATALAQYALELILQPVQ
jgi:hypothetical protein